jgi:hypothetical protein
MRSWTPQTLYEAKPWACILAGTVLAIGATAWSLWEGYWTGWRGLGIAVGVTLAIIGGATLQLRQDYRARSKWRREMRR